MTRRGALWMYPIAAGAIAGAVTAGCGPVVEGGGGTAGNGAGSGGMSGAGGSISTGTSGSGMGGGATGTSSSGSTAAGGTSGSTGAGGTSGSTGAGGTSGSTGAGGTPGSTGAGGTSGSGTSGGAAGGGPMDCGPCAQGEICNPGSGQCECAPGGPQPGAPWPMIGCDATHRGLSPFAGAQTGTIKWSVDQMTPIVVGTKAITIDATGTVYVPAVGELRAYNPGGQLKWSVPMAAFSPPAIGKDGTLYQPVTYAGGLYALNPADGSTRWIASGAPDQGAHVMIGVDGRIVFTNGGGISAVDPCGAPLWFVNLSTFGIGASPAITPAGITLAQIFGLHAIDPAGSLLWEQPIPGRSGGLTVGPDGTIYVGDEGELRAFDPGGAPIWSITLTSDAAVLSGVSIGPDGTLYVVDSYDGTAIYAVDPQNKAVLWSHADAEGAPAVVGADGVVYVPLDGGLHAYQPDGTELWALNLGRCGPVAIGADSTTYVFCNSTLYALGP